MKLYKKTSSKSIAITYFIVSLLYIVFSDNLLLFLFREDSSISLLTEIQSYKGVFFVILSSLLIYMVLKRRDVKTEDYIKKFYLF